MTQQSETQQSESTTGTKLSDTVAAPTEALAPPPARRVWPRSFADRLTAPLPGLSGMARFAREGAVRPTPEGLADIPRLPFEPGPLPRVDARTVAVSWAGHASWVVRIGGLTVLTDPVWSRRILGTPARITPVGVSWSELPRVDAVVISHNHYDHLDAPTLRRLPRETPVFGAGRARPLVPAPPVHPRHRAGLVGDGRTRQRPLRLRPGPPLVQARPHRHLSQPLGRLGAHRPRRAARLLRGRHRIRSLVRPHRAALPGYRPRAAAHRRVQPAVVAQRRPLRPGGGGPGRPGRRCAPDGTHALGDVRPVGGTGPRTPDPGTRRLAEGRLPREDLWTCRWGVHGCWAEWFSPPPPLPVPIPGRRARPPSRP